jgi:hypothetical protein
MEVEVIPSESSRTNDSTEFSAGAPADTWRGWRSVLGHTHTYSGRDDHGGTNQPPESYVRMARWAEQCGVDAVGMGSPYTPKSAATYGRFDETERDAYYRPDFDKLSVLDADEIESMLSDANRAGGGRTLFYLDNETPKGRYGHMWWLGYHCDFPAWHDYDQPYDRWMLDHADAAGCEDEPMPYERRPYLQILAAHRARGALGFWAHPTSWWRGDRGQFITNIASEMPAHAIAEGGLDGLVIMGYHPHRPQYQALWFELLDRGYRVPCVAEMDCGLSDAKTWASQTALLTYADAGAAPLTLRRLVDAFRRGRMFVSSGPLLTLSVDGHAMGEVAPTSRDQVHRVMLDVRPAPGQQVLGRVELLGRGGRVLWRRDEWRGGRVELSVPGSADRSYLVARAFGPESTGEKWREVRRTAVSNPVYLHPRGQGFNRPATTDVHVTIRPESPFAGGEVRFESMDGTLVGSTTPARGSCHEVLPASGRVTLVSTDGRSHTDYLVNANPAVLAAQRYLYRGRFLLDFPNLHPGEVPPEAWRIDRFADAMREVRLTY